MLKILAARPSSMKHQNLVWPSITSSLLDVNILELSNGCKAPSELQLVLMPRILLSGIPAPVLFVAEPGQTIPVNSDIVVDSTAPLSELKCTVGFKCVILGRRQHGDQDCVSVATQAILE